MQELNLDSSLSFNNFINLGVFQNNQLSRVVIPEGIEVIKGGAFSGNSLTSAEFPDSLVRIEGGAFQDNNFTTVVVPDNTSLSGFAFDLDVEIFRESFAPATVVKDVNYTLQSNEDNLILTGVEPLRGNGNEFINIIEGNAGNNKLRGFFAPDILKGNDGRDKIKGDEGADTLIGGVGGDILTGGSGSDSFVYETITDSGVTRKTRDKITDFQVGEDLIDLSQIDANPNLFGDQAFEFIGAAKFSEAGQARFKNGLLRLNVDDDRRAEFQVKLKGVTELFVDSLIL
ncbi:calcium-binding protein, hemolysin-type [Synechococcus sp. WH 7805]|nr:calcium-binding protein, hemolysin-type [Synechococcus sp. WH 7805]